jgi:DNA polymerase (family 10)
MATNNEIARVLREYIDLLTLDEGSPQAFRVRAYEKAVGAVREAVAPLADMSMSELQALDGVGRSTAEKILEYVATGTFASLEKLRAKYPPSLVELTRIPGLGPKTVLLLRAELGVETVDQLKAAVAAQQLRTLPGLGAKSEEKIATAIERLGLHSDERRTPIIRALPVAAEILHELRALPNVERAEYAGSLRRFRDTIGDIDILVAASEPRGVMEEFVSLSIAEDILAKGDTKSSIITAEQLQVDLRIVAPAEFGAAILYFTGSKQHNIELRQRAMDRGWLLNEYALSDAETEEVVAAETEAEIYAALGLEFIPPEMREGSGEIALAEGGLPRLVGVDDVRGDLHVHSTWSGDGRSSLEDMVGAAAERGLEYIAMTEHGEDLAINGLSRDEIAAEAVELDRLREQHRDLTILQGSELNIGVDGSLDYDMDFLLGLDWCVASVHSHFDLPQAEQTERVLAAIRHPAVNVIGHLTGRRIGRRPGIEVDFDAILDAAAETGTALEINSHLDRLDVPADWIRRARDREDVTWVISTDSHHVNEFANIRWGVANARRGWVPADRVANTLPADDFLTWARQKRERTG